MSGALTGQQAVSGAHAHERGYRDFMRAGLGARNPYPQTERLMRDRWDRGFEKAKDEASG